MGFRERSQRSLLPKFSQSVSHQVNDVAWSKTHHQFTPGFRLIREANKTHTLSVQEVINENIMSSRTSLDAGILEQGLLSITTNGTTGSRVHVLLAQSLDLSVDIGLLLYYIRVELDI